MELSIWGTVASKMATTLRRIQPVRPQGVILVHHTDQDHLIVWLYDADSSGLEEHLHCELGLLRPRLRQIGVTELGFGLSDDGRAWALVAQADQKALKTRAGQAFFRELLAEDLGQALREAEVVAQMVSCLEAEEVLARK